MEQKSVSAQRHDAGWDIYGGIAAQNQFIPY
jgi:hypothetical protein